MFHWNRSILNLKILDLNQKRKNEKNISTFIRPKRILGYPIKKYKVIIYNKEFIFTYFKYF